MNLIQMVQNSEKYYRQILEELQNLIADGYSTNGQRPIEISCGVVGYNVLCRACQQVSKGMLAPYVPITIHTVDFVGFRISIKIDWYYPSDLIGVKFSNGTRHSIPYSSELAEFVKFHEQLN